MTEKPHKYADEEALVLDLQKGETDAIKYLCEHYSAALYGIIVRILENQKLSEDVLQEVFIKIWTRIDQYDTQKGRLFTWMLNIARNAALDVKRSAGYKNQLKVQSADDSVNKVEGPRQNIDIIGMKELVDQLSDDQRQVLHYLYFKGYTHVETAEALELPLGTVKSRARAAIRNLRQTFSDR